MTFGKLGEKDVSAAPKTEPAKWGELPFGVRRSREKSAEEPGQQQNPWYAPHFYRMNNRRSSVAKSERVTSPSDRLNGAASPSLLASKMIVTCRFGSFRIIDE